jgi:hypothetical protein
MAAPKRRRTRAYCLLERRSCPDKLSESYKIITLPDRDVIDVEHRACGRAVKCECERFGDVAHVDKWQEVPSATDDRLGSFPQSRDGPLLERPGTYERPGAQDAPLERSRGEGANHRFHSPDRAADRVPRRGVIERRLLLDPLVAAVGISHPDALLDVAADAGANCAFE